MVFLTLDDIIESHQNQIDTYGGSHGIRVRASSRMRSSLGKLSDPLVGKLPMRECLSE